MDREVVKRVVREALGGCGFSLRMVADLAGASYQTIRSYRIGVRVPSGEGVLRIALAFEVHADRLRDLAAELREVAAKMG